MSVSLTHVSSRWIAEFVCAGSSHGRPTRNPHPVLEHMAAVLSVHLHRSSHTHLSENTKEGREGGTTSGPIVVVQFKLDGSDSICCHFERKQQ